MTEGIGLVRVCGQFADISAVCRLDTFRYSDDDGLFLSYQFLYFFQKNIHIERNLRQIDQIRTFAVFTLGKYCRTGQPAGISSHDLDDRHALHLIDQTITYQFLGNGGNIFCSAAVTGRMIRTLQVIIDRLGHTDKTDQTVNCLGIIGKLFYGVHGVITADIEKCRNLQFFQNCKYFLIDSFIFTALRQLIAAGAQEGCRCSLQKFHIHIVTYFLSKIYYLFLQKTLDAVTHTVYGIRPHILCCLIDTGKACIDHRGGTSGLSYDHIFLHNIFSLCSFLTIIKHPSIGTSG